MKKLFYSIIALLFSTIVFTTISCEKEDFTGDSGTFIDSRDNHKYEWIKIESQIWMAENIAYESINDTSWSYYNESLSKTYGRLYIWESAKKEACPDGWHLPTQEEWEILIDYLGGEYEAGGKLKEIGCNHWCTPNIGATDEVNFTALPGGYYPNGEKLQRFSYSGYWWSSTEYPELKRAYKVHLSYGAEYIDVGTLPKNCGASVRCIKDE